MGKIILIIVIVIIGLFAVAFIVGAILAMIAGSKKKRSLFVAKKMLSFSDDAKSMIFDVLKLHKAGEIEKINSITITSSDTLKEICLSLQIENRPSEFSSGKKSDEIFFSLNKKQFREMGYSEESSILLASLFLFDFDYILKS